VEQLLQVFDSWAGELTPHEFATFALPAAQRIAERVRAQLRTDGVAAVPMTLFAKGAHARASLLAAANAGYDTLGIDWTLDGDEARGIVGGRVALQGNMDPGVLYGGRAAIEAAVRRMCAAFRPAEGGKPRAWIANLGHGITPGVDPEDMRWFLECVHKYSAEGAAP
jgi:uroporphyrinogen decarboxylase